MYGDWFPHSDSVMCIISRFADSQASAWNTRDVLDNTTRVPI